MNRTRMSRLLSLTALAVIVAVFSSSAIWAQPADTLKVNYFSGANTGNALGTTATVYISNPGTSWTSTGTPGGNICAMIYVLDPFQELRECCGCSLTPDSLLTLDVNTNLTNNSNTPGTLTNGTIKIVSANGAPNCNPGNVAFPTKTGAAMPTPAIRAWGTHIQNQGYVTETDFQDATLSTGEIAHLSGLCRAIMSNSSGYGMCTCGTGD